MIYMSICLLVFHLMYYVAFVDAFVMYDQYIEYASINLIIRVDIAD